MNLKIFRVNLGYSLEQWEHGIKSPVWWMPSATPHLLISGVTGGGKSVLAQFVVKQLLDAGKDIAIADYKAGGDWDNIVTSYGEYTECDGILKSFYESFGETIREKTFREKYLLMDEFSSYALCKDSKEFKELMSIMGHLAFMGRSFGHHLILISQQFSSKVLDTAIREQFGIRIYMGRTISTESATMLFPNCEINKAQRLPKYCGYISTPEKELGIIQMPHIADPTKLKKLLEAKGSLHS